MLWHLLHHRSCGGRFLGVRVHETLQYGVYHAAQHGSDIRTPQCWTPIVELEEKNLTERVEEPAGHSDVSGFPYLRRIVFFLWKSFTK